MEARKVTGMIDRIQRFLPLTAHARPPLSATIRKLGANSQPVRSFIVTGVFYAGDEHGLMCRIELNDESYRAPLLVAPLSHVSFDRRHPICREIDACRKRGEGQGSMDERDAGRNDPVLSSMRAPPVAPA
jgi:hypothetical protein